MRLAAVIGFSLPMAAAQAQLRVASWNVTNYSGGRTAEFQTAIYGVFNGRALAPDVLIGQEFLSQSGVNGFLSLLNTAPGSPGDWAAAVFTDGADTDNAFFYRTTRVDFVAATVIAVGSSDTNNQPRDTDRYDIRPEGYAGATSTIGMYSAHMKAQGGTNDAGRRLIEAQRIRDNAEGVDTNGAGSGLPAGYHFLLGGDTNVQTSTAPEYVELVGSQPNNAGRFFDPISTPGSWNNNAAFRFVHTQDPAGGGGMDDRHDQILLSASLVDGQGMEYLGNPAIPYSTSTWDDPNHSYRAWGNDGTSFNLALTISGNQFVGPSIAQALVTSAQSSGHLPVVLNLRVPPKVDSDAAVDFGQVALGATAEQPVSVTNIGDVALWTAAGIADLSYTLSASAGFSAPGGSFVEAAGGGSNSHLLAMDTSSAGPKNGTLTILSNAPEQPVRVVALTGEVVVPCLSCDANCDTLVGLEDVPPFVDQLLLGSSPCSPCAGDTSSDLSVDATDIPGFITCLVTP
jgi:hypothetical protein